MPESLKTYMKRPFTLIEIMVALAALTLMMSFLFQFVIGSQKLWSASEHMSSSFDDAETVMSIVGEDLRNLRYSNKIGFTRPFLTLEEPAGLKYKSNAIPGNYVKMWVFFTQFIDSGDTKCAGVYPVAYIYVGDTDKENDASIRNIARTLFRVTLVKDGDGGIANVTGLQEDVTQIDFTATSGFLAANDTSRNNWALDLANMTLTEEDILVPDVTHFDLELLAPHGVANADFQNEYKNGNVIIQAAKSLPRGVQLKVALSPKDAVNANQWEETDCTSGTEAEKNKKLEERKDLLKKNERAFTKTISLDFN